MQSEVTVLFAGDSGDGIQLIGNAFAQKSAEAGHSVSTFSDFPAEIRAPQGTVPGVSGFKLQFGGESVYTAGDKADVLVVMNAAAYKKYAGHLKPDGILIANESGFDGRNLALAGYDNGAEPLAEARASQRVISVDIKKNVQAALLELPLGTAEKNRTKNMYVLGLLAWMYQRPAQDFEKYIQEKLAKSKNVLEANQMAFRAGYGLAETMELAAFKTEVSRATPAPGVYRTLVGNQAVALALMVAAKKANRPLFFAGYPITPASDILHELARHRNSDCLTFQAEDEIAAAVAALGAAFGGSLAATASSGPGISLKSEALGFAVTLELPLVVINVQRGGPSTGLPTKTEQSDLMQALYGRHGEAQMPVLAARSATDAFETVFLAAKIALEAMTPVMVLSDGYISNSAEAWLIPSEDELPSIAPPMVDGTPADGNPFEPFVRDAFGVRPWACPGQEGLEHRIGGLEKEKNTGNISYDPANHEEMVMARAAKVQAATRFYSPTQTDSGNNSGDLLVVGWGGTYGSIKAVVEKLQGKHYSIEHVHLRHIHPLPEDFGNILRGFKRVVVAELNHGQLVNLIRSTYLIDAHRLTKIQGQPFEEAELKSALKTHLQAIQHG